MRSGCMQRRADGGVGTENEDSDVAHVMFLSKPPRPETPARYRPIVVATHLKKLFEIVVLTAAEEYAAGQVAPHMPGFRQGCQPGPPWSAHGGQRRCQATLKRCSSWGISGAVGADAAVHEHRQGRAQQAFNSMRAVLTKGHSAAWPRYRRLRSGVLPVVFWVGSDGGDPECGAGPYDPMAPAGGANAADPTTRRRRLARIRCEARAHRANVCRPPTIPRMGGGGLAAVCAIHGAHSAPAEFVAGRGDGRLAAALR